VTLSDEQKARQDELKKKGDDAEAGGDNAPQWKPKEEGEQLAGILTKIDMVSTDFGDSHVITITDEDGDPYSVWLGTVLLGKFLDAAPGVGGIVVITFKGTAKSKADRTYKVYDMQSEEEFDGNFEEWGNVQRNFMARKQLLEEAAAGGSGLAPDSAQGQQAPF
jgi:hypothetical protein